MHAEHKTLLDLERRFWQSMVDQDTDAALELLCEPAFMVSPHGSMKFDHAGYRKMAEHGTQVLQSYEFGNTDVAMVNDDTAILSYDVTQVLVARGKSDTTKERMHDTSTWVRSDGTWRCAMHTEAPAKPG